MKEFISPLLSRDVKLFYLINNNLKCASLDLIMPKITHLGSGLFLSITIVLLILFSEDIWQKIAWQALVAVGVTSLVVGFLKILIARNRPFYSLENVNRLTDTFSIYSFPSGHSAAIFSLATVIYNNNLIIGIFAYFMAFIVAFSRAYLGVHYPSDIIIGSLLGMFIATIIYYRVY